MTSVRVLGVDPGTQLAGWAVLERLPDGRLRYCASGLCRLGRAPKPIAERLQGLHQELSAQISAWQPQALALEGAFFGLNARSALRLGEARGVVLLAASQADCPVQELAPATVKARVAGAGQATKDQVESLLRMHLVDAPESLASADEADAVAIALCLLLDPGFANASSLESPVKGPSGRRSSATLPPGTSFQ